jgi:nitroimidazol reductase NimA-like FMN-containing flavoprotein (pyridoxamine 5'-phosphate oxidase superfamily)
LKELKTAIPDRVRKGTISVAERVSVLDKTCPHAVLATDAAGQPYTSLVAYALTPDMKGVLFATPKATRKYRNILNNPRVSLLIDTRTNTPKDYMKAESVTILGNARPIRRGKTRTELAEIFLKKHPKLEGIIHSRETALIFVQITMCIHVTKFQTVSVWDVAGGQ